MDSRNFWAKTSPFQSISTHARISGIVATVILDELLSAGVRAQLCDNLSLDSDQLRGFVGYLVSLHDLGKIEYSFQVQNEDMRRAIESDRCMQEVFKPGTRHEKTGQSFLRAFWKESGEDHQSCALLSKVIGAHHQGKTGSGNYNPNSAWQPLRISLEAELKKFFLGDQPFRLPRVQKNRQGSTAAILLGIMILSDWIASGTSFADAETWIDSIDADNRIRAKSEQFLAKSGLKPYPFTWPESFCGLWPNIPADGKRPMQREIERQMHSMKEKPLAVLIEAPMGEGKTEAGIYAAVQMAAQWGKDGFYIALPTAATANQMVGRAQALLDMHKLSTAVRLLHSMAWLETTSDNQFNSADEHDEVASWLAPLKRGLLGQYAVGTVDQAMFAATNVKYGVLRLLGLSNKVLIIDEIHSYDAYMSEILVRLLEWCKALEIPVVMLSATLPPAMKEKLLAPYTSQSLSGNYPLLTMLWQNGIVQERIIPETSHRLTISTKLLPILNEPEKIAEAAIREVKDGGCLCILMNTVKEAQTIYSAIKARYSGDLLLFHAQFPAGRRAEIERECIRKYGKDKSQRPKQSILVATQVVEQSLDVDFDAMLTAIAPIDLLLQRMGRVFRHENTERPASHKAASVTVMVPKEGKSYGVSAYVYPECLLNSARRILVEKNSVQIPEDLAAIVQKGYDPSNVPEDEINAWRKKILRDEVDAGASQQYLLNAPDKLFSALDGFALYDDDEEAFSLSAKTRLGEPTIRVALLSPEDMNLLYTFLKSEGEHRTASVWDHNAAEQVMKQSVPVRVSRLGQLPDTWGIRGAMLLSGTRIVPTDENGNARLGNGNILRFDPELGLIIKEGEL